LNEAVVDATGAFHVRLPAGRKMRVETHVLGRPLPSRIAFETSHVDSTLADVVIPASA